MANSGSFTKGRQPLRRTGRPRGSLNRSTRDVREAIATLLQANVDNLNRWLTLVAEGDGAALKPEPAKALDIVARLCEYHIPKLARAEVQHGGEGFRIVISQSDASVA
jgi:hypothetical protein